MKLEGDLPDQLVHAVLIQLVPDRADALVASLPLLQQRIQLLLELQHIGPRRHHKARVLPELYLVLLKVPRRQKRIQEIDRRLMGIRFRRSVKPPAFRAVQILHPFRRVVLQKALRRRCDDVLVAHRGNVFINGFLQKVTRERCAILT
jgi:hypothetical protein